MKKILLAMMSALVLMTTLALPASAATVTRPAVTAVAQPPTCSNPALGKVSITNESPARQDSAVWNPAKAQLEFMFSATPKFVLSAKFSGSDTCHSNFPAAARVPIPDAPGLFLVVTPVLTLIEDGTVGAAFTWNPSLSAGFTVGISGFTEGPHSFSPGSATPVFTGSGTLTMGFKLDVAIETKGDVIGVKGTIGPEAIYSVTASSGTGTVCWKENVAATAQFSAFVDAFGLKKAAISPDWMLAKTDTLSHGCPKPVTGVASTYSVVYKYYKAFGGGVTKGSFTDVTDSAGKISGTVINAPDFTGEGTISGSLANPSDFLLSIDFKGSLYDDLFGSMITSAGVISGTFLENIGAGTWTATPEN